MDAKKFNQRNSSALIRVIRVIRVIRGQIFLLSAQVPRYPIIRYLKQGARELPRPQRLSVAMRAGPREFLIHYLLTF
jgi:hypothetical protein